MRLGDVQGETVDRDVLTAVPAESLAVGKMSALHSLSSMRAIRPQVKRREETALPYTFSDMGMTGGLYQASEAEIRKLAEDPKSIEAFVEASSWAPPVREVRPNGVLGWLMRLSPVQVFETDPDAAPPPDYDPRTDRPHCDLEGVWHGLHFLFTGTAWEGDEPAWLPDPRWRRDWRRRRLRLLRAAGAQSCQAATVLGVPPRLVP